MNAKSFLLATFTGFILLMVTYLVVVNNYVLLGRDVPATYGQFLTEASAEIKGKVLIESGSGSRYALDAEELSEYFDAPVFILSDNAGYPLRMKYFRLREALRPGDLLILPLEWNYYSESTSLTSVFVSRVAEAKQRTASYISSLPGIERLRFMLREYPVKYAFDGLVLTRDRDNQNSLSAQNLKVLQSTVEQGGNVSLGSLVEDGPVRIGYGAAVKGGCDPYLFSDREGFRMKVSDTFRENVELFARLREEGVSIHFVWPATADWKDNKCYDSRELAADLVRYEGEIRAVLAENGFQMAGDFRDSHFSSECFLNTYYHLRWNCADQRTKVLKQQLVSAGVKPLKDGFERNQLVPFLLSALADKRADLEGKTTVH